MKKLYLDVVDSKGCIGAIASDAEIIATGATLSPMDAKDKNVEYQKYADLYDLNFIFNDDIPQINFYTVPWVDIFAKDSHGGFLGTIGQQDSNAPICYINKENQCFSIANTLNDSLLALASNGNWKTSMTPNNDIAFYKSKADAAHSLEFIEIQKDG